MCRTLSSMPFMTKFALFGIGVPFLVYSFCYALSESGVSPKLSDTLDSKSSMKFVAVSISTSLQIIFAAASVETRKIYFRMARGKINTLHTYTMAPFAMSFIFVLACLWRSFDRFGSVYVDTVSGIINGILYQFGWFYFSYGLFVGVLAIAFRVSISIQSGRRQNRNLG